MMWQPYNGGGALPSSHAVAVGGRLAAAA